MLPSRLTIANADMIPPFQDRGYLPPGVHPAKLDEVEARFGRQTELRRVQMESIGWLVDLARRAGVTRLVINGSFVTDVPEPNDVDCVLLVGPGFPSQSQRGSGTDSGNTLSRYKVQWTRTAGMNWWKQSLPAIGDSIPKV